MYPKYDGKSINIIEALLEVGEKDVSFGHRRVIARVNGIKNYIGEPRQNTKMLVLLKKGKLVRV